MRAIRYQTTDGRDAPGGVQRVSGNAPDGYLDRLIKFIPAETLTLFTALVVIAQARSTSVMLIILLAICLIVTPLYLFVASIPVPADQRPRLWMYGLAPIAFIVWAVFTNAAVRALPAPDIDDGWATFFLVLTVLLIPAVDQALGALFPRSKNGG
jgi:hypothetical protein